VTDVVGRDTLLEGDIPEEAANYGSLAELAAKTEEDWTSQLETAEEDRWGGGILDGLFAGLQKGKPFIAALFEALVQQAFEGIEDFFEDVDEAFDSVAGNFNGKWRDILAAQDAADYANAQLAVRNRLIVDLFDGAAGNLSGDWSISYSGSFGAGGTIKQDGRGNAWWEGFGGILRTGRARYTTTQTATDKQVIATVMPLRVQDPSIGSDSYLRLCGRMNTAKDSFVYGEIGNNSAAIGCMIDGTRTEFTEVATATSNGDSWEFLIGTASDYEYVLKRNGITIVSWTESTPATYKGSDYRSVGFEMVAGDRLLFLAQTSPGTMAVFSADDQD
jgi:hypothetical protein